MAKKNAASTSQKVDSVLGKMKQWHDETAELRAIALGCGLTEDLKWGQPCYAHDGGNVVLIHGFKAYCAYLFFKGALLADPEGLLIQQTENVQSARQIRFTSVRDIAKKKSILKDYIQRAMAIEKAGLKVKLKTTAEYAVPPELQKALDENPALERAFEALTPGRQRGYIYFISQAKQPQTREARVEKNIPRILHGLGIDD